MISENAGKKRFFSIVLIYGFITLLSQLILIRQFLCFFSGNELLISLVLLFWMIITGKGAFFGGFFKLAKISEKTLLLILNILSLLVILTFLFANYLIVHIFLPGVELSLIQVVLFVSLILLPFCLVSGYGFTVLSHFLSIQRNENYISKVYLYETIGCVIAGLSFSFLLVVFLKPLQILTGLNLVVAILSLFLFRNAKLFKGIFIITALFIIVFLFDVDLKVRSMHFPGEEIRNSFETAYGQYDITTRNGQVNYYQNGNLLYSEGDKILNEEMVHFAMLNHPLPENILVLGGPVGGIIKELFKYSGIKRIDYVELDSSFVKAGTELLTFDRLYFHFMDPCIYMRETDLKYDVVLHNFFAPENIQLNRFYTIEFFKSIPLNDDHVISTGLPATPNYLGQESGLLNSVHYKTLLKCFTNVLIIPSSKNFYLASNKELNLGFVDSVKIQGLKTTYVNRYYFDPVSVGMRSENIKSLIDTTVSVNQNFYPEGYKFYLNYWLKKIGGWGKTIGWLIFGVILFFWSFLFFRLNEKETYLLIAGFISSSAEFALIVLFQIFFGYIYQTIGLLFAVFMLGLAVGVAINNSGQFVSSKRISWGLCFLVALIPVLFILKPGEVFIKPIIYIGLFLIAIATGLIFRLASLQERNIQKIASIIYSADLWGAGIGLFLISVFLIPRLGILNSLFFVSVFCMAFLIINLFIKKRGGK